MAKDTRERILASALELFSQKGYEGTNIRELTASLGLVKSGVYKHFAGKEDIWNALLDEMIVYYEAHFGSPAQLPPVPETLEGLISLTMRMVDFTVHDKKVVMTRKLLSIEQFRDERARDLATKHFLTGLEQMFTAVFSGMMEKGLIKRDDPAMLAFAYTAPISSLIHLCSREPDQTPDALARIEAFSRHFIRVYGAQPPAAPFVRRLTEKEIPAALELSWRVFTAYESPDYGPEGTEEFEKTIHDEKYLSGIRYYGAFDGDNLIGVLGIRAEKRHICFFFVDGAFHRRGVGTRLFERVRSDFPGRITLNSSPYGLPFYKALGFVPTDAEQTVRGIRFAPMSYGRDP